LNGRPCPGKLTLDLMEQVVVLLGAGLLDVVISLGT